MNDEYKKEKRIVLIVMILFVLIIVTSIGNKGNEKYHRLNIAWQEGMARNGVKSLVFTLERNEYETGDHGSSWQMLKRLYINGKLANPDTLYNGYELLYKHCGIYYFYVRGSGSGIDSVVYEFPPKNRYEA